MKIILMRSIRNGWIIKEKKLEQIADIKKTKGKTSAIFSTLNSIRGKKKTGPEMVAMKDPETGNMIFDPEALKSASVDYCVKLLQNTNVDPEFKDDIDIENLLHYYRMMVNDQNDQEELTYDDFQTRNKKIGSKNGEKYKFLINAGQGFQNCLFNLFKQVWATEEKPQQWRNTIVIQLYKGKGSINEFQFQRYIHTKEEVPKYFEGIVVDKSKDKLVKGCSKFQIGGIQKHRSQEHLFTVKRVISLYVILKIPLFLQIFDLSKYFDREILKNAMDTLYNCGVTGKLYRLWYNL